MHQPFEPSPKKDDPRCTLTRNSSGELHDWQPRVSRFPETNLGASILRQACWCCRCWQRAFSLTKKKTKATTDGTLTWLLCPASPGWTDHSAEIPQIRGLPLSLCVPSVNPLCRSQKGCAAALLLGQLAALPSGSTEPPESEDRPFCLYAS